MLEELGLDAVGQHLEHQSWREAIEVVAMDGFTGFKTATAEELRYAVAPCAVPSAQPLLER